MSESIILLIDRRGRGDLVIFGVMAVLSLVVVWVLVVWVKPWL